MDTGVSIILPNYNGENLLGKYIPILLTELEDTRIKTEVIVVDDASKDGSLEMLAKCFPQVKVISQKKNLGFGETCNQGAANSSYDKLLFMNTDIRVEKGFLSHLVNSLDNDTFAVSAKVIEECEKKKVNVGLNYGYIAEGTVLSTGRLNLDIDSDLGREKKEILWATGGMMLCWKDKFLELGGFDPLYSPFYCEDLDLSYRAWKRGWKVYYEPNCVVYHEHQGTIGRLFSRKYVTLMNKRNRFLFMWKNLTDEDLLRNFFISFCSALIIPNPTRQLAALWAIRFSRQISARRKEFAKYIVVGDKDLVKRFELLRQADGR